MTTLNQIPPSDPPAGWHKITIDITIDGVGEALKESGKTAQAVAK